MLLRLYALFEFMQIRNAYLLSKAMPAL